MAQGDDALETAQGGMWYLYVKGPDGKFRLHPRGFEFASDHERYMKDCRGKKGEDYIIKYHFAGIGVKDVLCQRCDVVLAWLFFEFIEIDWCVSAVSTYCAYDYIGV